MANVMAGWREVLQGLAAFEATHAWVFWVSVVVLGVATIVFSLFELNWIDSQLGDLMCVYILVEWLVVVTTTLGVIATYGSVCAGLASAIVVFICAMVTRLLLALLILKLSNG